MTSVILRPNSDVLTTGWLKTEADYHSCVDEVVADGDSTYVSREGGGVHLRLGLPNPDLAGVISKVSIYITCRSRSSTYKGTVKTLIRTHSTDYLGNAQTPVVAPYTLYSTEYTVNPNTSNAWTWDEIDALECGLYGSAGVEGEFPDFIFHPIRCTQVYVTVEYTVAPIEINLSDTVAIADSIIKTASLNKADSVGVADSILKTIGLHKSDSVSIADAISKTVSLIKTESVTITDSISKRVNLIKTEAVAIADIITKTIGLIKADIVVLADSIAKTISLNKADTVTISDAISKAVSLIKADAVAIADAINVSLSVIHAIHLSDIVTITDRLVGELRVKTYLKQVIARMQIKGMDIARMSINKMGIARMPLFRWIIRRWTA